MTLNDSMTPSWSERFQQRGHGLASQLDYCPDLVNEAIAILQATLGAWLDAPESEQTLGPMRVHGHALRHCLNVAGDLQLVDALELCHYLKTVPGAHAAPIIAGLKSDYRHTLLQLAFAWRFHNLGAQGIALEPPVDKGRLGDFAFEILEQSFVGECYIPGRSTRGGPGEERDILVVSVQDFFEARADRCLSVGIKLLKPLQPKGRRFVLQCLRKVTAAAPPCIGFYRSEDVVVSVADCLPSSPASAPVFVHPAFPVEGDPPEVASIGMAPRDELFSPESREIRLGTTLSRVGIWLDSEAASEEAVREGGLDVLGRIVKRLRKKLNQTKRGDGAHRILVTESWVASPFSQLVTSDFASAIRSAGLLDRSNVEGFLFVSRSWDASAARHRYHVHPVETGEEGTLWRLAGTEPSLSIPPRHA